MTYRNKTTQRGAVVRNNGNEFQVIFGFTDQRGEDFRPSYRKGSRFYRTEAGAHRSARRWVRNA